MRVEYRGMKKRTLIDLIILLFVLIIGLVAVRNATAIGDWWYFLRYEPSEEVAQLATDAGMGDEGRKLFYRLDPQFVDRQTMQEKCGSDALGCTVGRNIYILNDFTPRQYNRSIVTAAHEMLHVAWSRIDDKTTLQADLDTQIDKISDNLYQKFSKFDGEDYYNEAHSYIGTEQSELIPDLKTHYQRYFDNRQKTLDALEASPEG